MKIIRHPEVYLVGRQTLDQDQIDQFLSDTNVGAWTTDTATAAEVLPEVSGPVCY